MDLVLTDFVAGCEMAGSKTWVGGVESDGADITAKDPTGSSVVANRFVCGIGCGIARSLAGAGATADWISTSGSGSVGSGRVI